MLVQVISQPAVAKLVWVGLKVQLAVESAVVGFALATEARLE